ncbi:MAG TPA: RING-H2 finger protein [Sulfurovum sp.]|nr:RING-H2 finger protein [Sulfurovum sp.]
MILNPKYLNAIQYVNDLKNFTNYREYNKIIIEHELKLYNNMIFNYISDNNNKNYRIIYNKIKLIKDHINSKNIIYNNDCFCMCKNNLKYIKNHCGHQFHRKCITEWLHYDTKCPICRKKWYLSKNILQDKILLYNNNTYTNIYYDIGIDSIRYDILDDYGFKTWIGPRTRISTFYKLLGEDYIKSSLELIRTKFKELYGLQAPVFTIKKLFNNKRLGIIDNLRFDISYIEDTTGIYIFGDFLQLFLINIYLNKKFYYIKYDHKIYSDLCDICGINIKNLLIFCKFNIKFTNMFKNKIITNKNKKFLSKPKKHFKKIEYKYIELIKQIKNTYLQEIYGNIIKNF